MPTPDCPADALISRSPHQAAAESARNVLRTYPPALLERAARRSVRIWLLDPDEPVASAAPLDARARARRWHNGTIGLDNCAGLTVPVPDGVLVIAPWHRPAVLRHELGHALSVLLTSAQRRRIERTYEKALARTSFVVPLAARSVGEYVACGLACFTDAGARHRLQQFDPALAAVLDELWRTPRPAQRARWPLSPASFGAVFRVALSTQPAAP